MRNENKTEMTAMSLKLPAAAHDAIRSIAAEQHRSINAEVNVAIERHIRNAQER